MRLALAISASLVLLFSPAIAQARTINVSTVAELNSAVGERNATVVVAPGTYELTQALVLAEGVKLRGPNVFRLDRNGVPVPISGDTFVDPAHEAVLDGSGLPGPPNPFDQVGVINAGANNDIRGLTILGNELASAGVDTQLIAADGGPHIVITKCLLERSGRGVRLVSGIASSGVTSSAVLESNVIRRSSPENSGPGIVVEHAETNNNTWNVDLHSNRVYGTDTALDVVMFASNNSTISIASRQNVYTNNRIGVSVLGGFDSFIGPSQNNLTKLDSKSDTITNNFGPGGHGVGAIAGVLADPSRSGMISGNDVRLKFLNTVFTNGQTPENGDPGFGHIDAFLAGVYTAPGDPVGTDNTVSALVRGATSNGDPATFLYTNGFPDDPGDPTGSNHVTTTGSDRAFERANEGLQAPFDLGG